MKTSFLVGIALNVTLVVSAVGLSTNSWMDGSGKWETVGNWSLGTAPANSDSADVITNAGNNTVTIDATTSGSFSNTLTINTLIVSAPFGSMNTLALNNAGTLSSSPPLLVSNRVTIGSSGVIGIINSSLQIDSSTTASNFDGVIVGVSGSGNQLSIIGVLSSFLGRIGSNVGSSNNTVIVSGTGSVWHNSGVVVGSFGSRNSLIISNGGLIADGVFGSTCTIGNSSSSSNNTVLIVGAGSVWTNGAVNIGSQGSSFNSLIISNGGAMFTIFGSLVHGVSGSNNTVLVSGGGSVLSNGSVLAGSNGSFNSLIISNGGAILSSSACVVGNNTSSRSNTVLVIGAGSAWSNGSVAVGNNGPFNSLIITNGGKVFSGGGTLGVNSSGSNNRVVVAGIGSVWSNQSSLIVGFSGTSNLLLVTGGIVFATNVVIGSLLGASNNVLRIDSGSLIVKNVLGNGCLVVGQLGQGTLMIDGGTVTVDSLIATNGANSSITFNSGTLTVRAGLIDNNQDFVVGGTFIINGGSVTVSQLVLTNNLSSMILTSGTLHAQGTAVTNGQEFVVGNGAVGARFHLLGGVHSFNDGLRARNTATLSGCGTINGTVVIDAGGTVLADCGGTLTFTGIVTNNGAMAADNGSVLESYGTVVNNGAILLFNGGTTNFHGVFINNGTVLNGGNVNVGQVSKSGADIIVRIQSATGFTYQLQITPSLESPTWTNSGASQAGTGGMLTFTDSGGATNQPSRFYRVDVTAP